MKNIDLIASNLFLLATAIHYHADSKAIWSLALATFMWLAVLIVRKIDVEDPIPYIEKDAYLKLAMRVEKIEQNLQANSETVAKELSSLKSVLHMNQIR